MLLKIDDNGTLIWQKHYGGDHKDSAKLLSPLKMVAFFSVATPCLELVERFLKRK